MAASASDTIAAPVTGTAATPVGIVRVSGSAVRAIAERLSPSGDKAVRNPRTAIFAPIYDHSPSGNGALLDHALLLFFPGPHSFTGEDVLEIQAHGSRFIIGRLLDGLRELGARPALPGEFSERAFLNGKIDLSQAEAISDLIAAQSEAQNRVAQEQLAGKLSQAVESFGTPLRELVAEIEAYIDFPDEDIEPLSYAQWSAVVATIAAQLRRALDTYARGKICREGALVVLAGAPNAGKSSLLNRLLGEDRAIVTAVPGTTRDSIEEGIDLAGLPVRLCDTAGIVEAESAGRLIDAVEEIGIARSWERLRHAEVVLLVLDSEVFRADAALSPILRKLHSEARLCVPVLNKMDLVPESERAGLLSRCEALFAGAAPVAISARHGSGLEELRTRLASILLPAGTFDSSVLVTTKRHYDALLRASLSLEQAQLALDERRPSELVAADIRAALGSLADIVGVTHTEDILGLIFSKFCIGK